MKAFSLSLDAFESVLHLRTFRNEVLLLLFLIGHNRVEWKRKSSESPSFFVSLIHLVASLGKHFD